MLRSEFVYLHEMTMSFPTWEMVRECLTIESEESPTNVFGTKPLTNEGNSMCHAIISGHEGIQMPIGVDIPVLLKNKDDNKILFIIGESPLRDNKTLPVLGNTLIGVPYAIHQKEGNPKQCDIYKAIFDRLAEKGFSFYITDIIKVWWKGKKLTPNETDFDILHKEITCIRKMYPFADVKYITWGKKAKEALKKTKEVDDKDIIYLLHPSKQNWNNWKLMILEKAIYEHNIHYALERYPCKGSATKAEYVVDEFITKVVKETVEKK